jgi:NTE family protein
MGGNLSYNSHIFKVSGIIYVVMYMNGIVLQGGGAKGSYHIGVWQALREMGIEIHAVTGTSIGALNGVMIAQERFEDVYNLWYNIEPSLLFKIDSQLYKKFLEIELNSEHFSSYFKYLRKVFSEGGMDVSPLKSLIEEMVDEKRARASKIDFGLVTVDLTDLEPLELFIDDIPKGKLHEYLMGSCHLPIFKMDKLDGKILLDGMFYDNQPVKLMMQKSGIDTVILVENRGLGVKHKVDLSGITVHRISPSGDTGRTLDLTTVQSRRNLKMGYYDAMRTFKGYKGVRYYLNDFSEEEILKALYHLDFDCVRRVSELLGIKPIKSRRQIFETVIPELARILKLPVDTEYKDFFIAVIESVAEYFKIDRFKIYDFNELLEIIGEALSRDEHKAVYENRRLIDRLLKQGNIIIGNLNEELIVEVMTAVLMDVRDINGLSEKI